MLFHVPLQGFLGTDPCLLRRLIDCLLVGTRKWGKLWLLQMRAAHIIDVKTQGTAEHLSVLSSAMDPGTAIASKGSGGAAPQHQPVMQPLLAMAESSSATETIVLKDAVRLMHVQRPGRLVVAAYADDSNARKFLKTGRCCKDILAGTVKEVVAFLDLLLAAPSEQPKTNCGKSSLRAQTT